MRRRTIELRIVAAFGFFAAAIALGLALDWPGKALRALEHHGMPHPLALGAGAAALALAGLAIGRVTARRVLAPVEELGHVVETARPEDLVERLSSLRGKTEVDALAHQLEDALRRVRAAGEREQQLTRFASHELRSPVAVIKGASELIDSAEGSAAPAIRRPLERIQRAAEDMEGIVEAFLWLSRDTGARHSESCPLVPIVERVVARHRHVLDGKPVEVEISVDGAPRLDAPAPVVAMVVGNLVANAFHYTEEGTVRIEVQPHSLAVIDTGSGMSVDDLDSFTQSFVRGPTSVGHGLGLSIVRSLSERLQWRLWLDSQPGEGTTVTLYF